MLACLGCPTDSTQPHDTPTACPAGQRALSVGCGWLPDTITIGPGVQTNTVTPLNGGAPQQISITGCFLFSPNPLSVHRNQPVYWTNNSTVSVTVFSYGSGTPTPYVTLAPGQSGGGVFWSSAGFAAYSVSSCTSGDGKPGQLVITET
ncbi:MAG: hypothetical protein JWM41_2020 [Gemmatimonadetes bacterium]|nr:hypothetical protein [Gemmatimonadota bacterium]